MGKNGEVGDQKGFFMILFAFFELSGEPIEKGLRNVRIVTSGDGAIVGVRLEIVLGAIKSDETVFVRQVGRVGEGIFIADKRFGKAELIIYLGEFFGRNVCDIFFFVMKIRGRVIADIVVAVYDEATLTRGFGSGQFSRDQSVRRFRAVVGKIARKDQNGTVACDKVVDRRAKNGFGQSDGFPR